MHRLGQCGIEQPVMPDRSLAGRVVALQWALLMHGFDPDLKEDIVPGFDADPT